MMTLTEITAEEQQRRDRAARYESLRNRKDWLQGQVAALDASALDVTALEDIRARIADVPEGLTFRGGKFIVGPFELKTLLTEVIEGGLNDLRRRDQKRAALLDGYRQELAQVDAALKEFE